MTVHDTDEQVRDRRRRQAQARQQRQQEARQSEAIATTEPAAILPAAPDDDRRAAQWQGCCKFAFNLRHHPKDWEEFQTKLRDGYQVSHVDDQRMVSTAIALVVGLAAAGVRRWDWLPAPSDAELAEPEVWATRRLAHRRVEEDEAERERRFRQKAARAFRQSPSVGTGVVNPVHLQRSKHNLDELAQRLEYTKSAHEAAGREFTPKLLDHRSLHYIKTRNGGISNKQVIIMACEITKQRERRPFDDNWQIVMNWWNDWKTQRQPNAAA
jgi:hypothetical protein